MGSKNYDHPRSIWTHNHMIIIQILWIILSYYYYHYPKTMTIIWSYDHIFIRSEWSDKSDHEIFISFSRWQWRIPIFVEGYHCQVCVPEGMSLSKNRRPSYSANIFHLRAFFLSWPIFHDTEFASSSFIVLTYTQNTQMI
jgi:hypothetical protein